MSGRILIIDDDHGARDLLEAGLTRRGFRVAARSPGQEALDLLCAEDFDVIVTDLTRRGVTGLELCARLVESRPEVPVIVITAAGSLDRAAAAIRAGAYDFITGPLELDALQLTLERALRHRALREDVKRLRRTVEGATRDARILGESPAMRPVFDLLDRVADAETAVLLTGEDGTGKALVARSLHERSRRAGQPFLSVSCAGVPEALLERELFGDGRDGRDGRDAGSARTGLFLRASGGTLYLEDIADLPALLQQQLARALEQRVVRPVGSDREIPFDVRVITATSRELSAAVEERRFREDLHHLLSVVRVDLPPLRSRGADVLLLAQQLLKQFAASKGRPVEALSAPAAEKLLAYPWPGNVRELASCIERAVALARFNQIAVDDLPEKIRSFRRSNVMVADDDPSGLVPMDELERRYITRVLEVVGGNKTLAAQILGFDRATLYRKLDRQAHRGGGPGPVEKRERVGIRGTWRPQAQPCRSP